MTTVLEAYTTDEQRCVVRFLWAKGHNAKDIHKEMYSVYGGECLSRKAVHNWVEKRGKCFADDDEVETEVWKWLRQESKDFYAAGCGMCREINIFSRFVYHMCYVLYPFVTCLGSQDSVVSTAAGYGLDDRGVGVRVPLGSKIYFSPCRPDRLWGPPNLLANGYGGLFPRE
jgi:hypothetical protein